MGFQRNVGWGFSYKRCVLFQTKQNKNQLNKWTNDKTWTSDYIGVSLLLVLLYNILLSYHLKIKQIRKIKQNPQDMWENAGVFIKYILNIETDLLCK